MPLSEQEQRMLDEMERHLMQRDADVVSPVQGAKKLSYRNVVIGSVLILVGLIALVAGVAIKVILVGVLGFVLMLTGVILAATPVKAKAIDTDSLFAAADAANSGAASAKKKNFTEKMNERWEKRQDDRP